MTAIAPAKPTTSVACHHCGLAVPPALVNANEDAQFCCNGCRVAYETIHGCGLDEYYLVRDRLANDRQPASGKGDQYAAFDSQVFLDKHATDLPQGLSAIEFYLDSVHCAACVWLVERLPRLVPGVVEARLSLASSSARVVWDPERCPLSTIAAALDRLGYPPHPMHSSAVSDAQATAERARLIHMAVAGALAGNNMLIALALYAGVFDGMEPRYATLFRWTSMAIGWLSLLWPGGVFFRSAWSAVISRAVNLDVPISLALAVGAIAGTANVLLNRGDIYFDSLGVLVFLLLVGRFIQTRQQRWARDAVRRRLSLTPSTCRVLRGESFVEEPIEALTVGDQIEVRPGQLIAADGVIASGCSSVDRSILTGESFHIPVAAGDKVEAGVQNVSATIRVSVQAVGDTTRVGRLMQLVEQGLREKPAIVQFTDRVAGRFVAVVVAIAAINFTTWAWSTQIATAIDTTVALLIVACPCALGLATPLTMAIAIGQASRRGILVKSASVLETLGRVGKQSRGRMLLDKTGTLTQNSLKVVAWHGDKSLQPLVAELERDSNHPVAKAIVDYLSSPNASSLNECWDRIEHHGKGVEAMCLLGAINIGSPKWLREQYHTASQRLREAIHVAEEQGQTAIAVAINQEVRAVVCLEHQLREEANNVVAELVRQRWTTEILSGDAPGAVAMIGRRLGMKQSNLRAQVSPEEKLAAVRTAKSRGSEHESTVVMVGDGVNDAAALAAADVGISVHGGAEAALAAGDVYIANPGLAPILELTRLARRTVGVVRQNLAISLAYNVLCISLAAAGVITPLLAAILMPISSATVLGSAIYSLTATPKSSAARPRSQ